MAVDPKGVEPGLTPGAQVQPKILNMKCKDPNCTSIEAIEIQITESVGAAPSQRVYRCVKCSRTHSLNVGGFVNV